MDHLKTDQERKDRWYSKLTPRPVAVKPATDWNDLLVDSDEDASVVNSIPYDWLLHKKRTPSGLKQVLGRNGFAIVSGVLSPEECHEALDLAGDFLAACSVAEKASAAKEGESSSSAPSPDDDNNDPYFPQTVEGGILPFYGSGHSSYAWYVRSRPSIRQVFEMLYNDNTSSDTDTDTDVKTTTSNNQLVASLDGVILWTQGNHPSGDAGWFHVDQNPHQKPGFCAVQGLVNLLPTTRQTGGNVLVAQSHLHFPQHYLQECPKNGSTSDEEECRRLFYPERLREVDGDDWLEIDPRDTTVLESDKVIMCLLQPGDLLLWDSRTVHCSHPPQAVGAAVADSALASPPGREPVRRKKDLLIRAATLVIMMPMRSIPDQVLRRRLELVKNSDDALSYRTLTHWVNKCAPLGQERPEQVALEKQRVETILRWQQEEERQHSSRGKVLLSYNDLNLEQQRLVAGLDGSCG